MFETPSTPDPTTPFESRPLVPEPAGLDLDALADAATASEADAGDTDPAGYPGGTQTPAAAPSFLRLLPSEVEARLAEAGWERYRPQQALGWGYGQPTRDPPAM